MSVPALEHWFSLAIRRNRKSFIIACLALAVTFVVCIFVWFFFAKTSGGKAFGFAIFGIPAAICSYLLVAQRLRDFNVSGWFSLLWFVVNAFDTEIRLALTAAFFLALCGIPGTVGPNRYGDDPTS